MIYIFEFKKHWNFPLHSPLCPKFTSVLLPCGNGNSKLSKTGLVCSETLHSVPLAQWDPQRWLCATPTHSRSSRNWIGYKTVIKKRVKDSNHGKTWRQWSKWEGWTQEKGRTHLWGDGRRATRTTEVELQLWASALFHVHDKNASLSTETMSSPHWGELLHHLLSIQEAREPLPLTLCWHKAEGVALAAWF